MARDKPSEIRQVLLDDKFCRHIPYAVWNVSAWDKNIQTTVEFSVEFVGRLSGDIRYVRPKLRSLYLNKNVYEILTLDCVKKGKLEKKFDLSLLFPKVNENKKQSKKRK